MKKLYILICLLLFTILSTWAQRSFESYGFQTQILKGTNSAYSYYIRLLPNERIDGSMLALNLQTAKTLNFKKSYLHVLVNDEPVSSILLPGDSISRLLIPLKPSGQEKASFLKLTIRAQLYIGDDPCQDENNPSLWLKVMPQSSITWAANKDYGLSSINLSNTLFTKKAIVYPNNISAGELQAVALVYAKLRRAGVIGLKLYAQTEMPAYLNDFVYVGLLHKIKPDYRSKINIRPDAGEGLVYLSKKSSGTDIDQVLFLTAKDNAGLAKALDAVLTKGILDANFQDYLLIKKSGYKPYAKTNRLYLSDLEDNTPLMTGSGSLSHDYNFKTSAFEDLPADINAEFQIKYSGLKKEDRGYFNIYLNNILINSSQLNELGVLRVSTTINRYQIKKFNTLRTEFVFYPANGVCIGNFRNFIGQVDAKNSFLNVTTKLKEKQLSFYGYPDAFQEQSAILVSKKALSSSVLAISRMVYHLNDHYTNEVKYRPTIDFTDHADQYRGRNIILVTDRSDSILSTLEQIPLQYNHAFAIYDDSRNNIIYKLSAPDRSVIAQIFEDDRFPKVLSITIPDTGNSTKELQNAIVYINEQANQFSGNILISNEKNHLTFNLAQNSNNVKYMDEENNLWLAFWDKYKLLFLSGVLLIVFLAYIYVRNKVNQSQTIVNP